MISLKWLRYPGVRMQYVKSKVPSYNSLFHCVMSDFDTLKFWNWSYIPYFDNGAIPNTFMWELTMAECVQLYIEMGCKLVFSSNCPIQGQAKFTRRLCLILLAVLLFWVRTIWCSRLHQLQPLVCTILWRARYNHLWDKKGIDWSSTIMTVIWTCSLFGFIWMDSA